MKIDFIIVGAMKAGTSSLGFHLNNHPDVYLPEKELQFFNDDKKFKHGYEYYYNQFKPGKEKVLGEKTPTYSYQENVAKRIHDFNPNIKLIWIFRNPVDRAYSNYLHAVKNGAEMSSFKNSVKFESKRIKDDIWRGYMERSMYIKQVERYLKLFKREQMYFVLFENMMLDTEKELKDIFNFLGVDSTKGVYYIEQKNKTVMPRSKVSLYLTRKLFGTNSFVFRVVKKLNVIGKKPGYDKLKLSEKKELNQLFTEPNKLLQQLTGLDLKLWDM